MNRRKFITIAGGVAAATGVAVLIKKPDLFKNSNSSSKKYAGFPHDTKKIFADKGACATSLCFIVNRELGNNDDFQERGATLLAPGLMFTGHQCGMLWGPTLATGAECYRRFSDQNQAMGKAIEVSQSLIQEFLQTAKSCNCRDITGYDLSKVSNLARFTIKGLIAGPDNNLCAKLADRWAPIVVNTVKNNLQIEMVNNQETISCATEVAKKMGASKKECVMVSGFAGGLGLSGNGCGALAAAVFMKTLDWCKKHPGKSPMPIDNPIPKNTLKQFYSVTGQQILCSSICGQKFKSVDEHTQFIKNGGCSRLIDVLAKA